MAFLAQKVQKSNFSPSLQIDPGYNLMNLSVSASNSFLPASVSKSKLKYLKKILSERVFSFFQIFFSVLVVLGLVEEESVPCVTSPPSIHIEKFQRMVTRSHCKSCSRAHIRIIVFELVVLPDFLVNQKVPHATVFSLFFIQITSFLTKSCTKKPLTDLSILQYLFLLALNNMT